MGLGIWGLDLFEAVHSKSDFEGFHFRPCNGNIVTRLQQRGNTVRFNYKGQSVVCAGWCTLEINALVESISTVTVGVGRLRSGSPPSSSQAPGRLPLMQGACCAGGWSYGVALPLVSNRQAGWFKVKKYFWSKFLWESCVS